LNEITIVQTGVLLLRWLRTEGGRKQDITIPVPNLIVRYYKNQDTVLNKRSLRPERPMIFPTYTEWG